MILAPYTIAVLLRIIIFKPLDAILNESSFAFIFSSDYWQLKLIFQIIVVITVITIMRITIKKNSEIILKDRFTFIVKLNKNNNKNNYEFWRYLWFVLYLFILFFILLISDGVTTAYILPSFISYLYLYLATSSFQIVPSFLKEYEIASIKKIEK